MARDWNPAPVCYACIAIYFSHGHYQVCHFEFWVCYGQINRLRFRQEGSGMHMQRNWVSFFCNFTPLPSLMRIHIADSCAQILKAPCCTPAYQICEGKISIKFRYTHPDMEVEHVDSSLMAILPSGDVAISARDHHWPAKLPNFEVLALSGMAAPHI